MGDGRHLNAASTIVAKTMRIIMVIGEFKTGSHELIPLANPAILIFLYDTHHISV